MRVTEGESVVAIDSFSHNLSKYAGDYAIVCVDVVRLTTTAMTAVAMGRRCFPASTIDEALELSNRMADDRPLMSGAVGEKNRLGIPNSPAALASRYDLERPLILLSSDLLRRASAGLVVFLASLRNYAAAAEMLLGRYRKVAIVGAGERGLVGEEDEMCAAWMADILATNGYRPASRRTRELIDRWKSASPTALRESRGFRLLRDSGQDDDCEFILSHVNDIAASFLFAEGEVLMIPRESYDRETPAIAIARDQGERS